MAEAKTRGSAWVGWVGIVAAVVVAVAIWAVGKAAGLDWSVDFGADPIDVTLPTVVAAVVVAALLGWALLAVLRRASHKGVTTWTVIAIVVALASLLGPLTAHGALSTRLTLAAIHLAVAAIVIPTLRHSGRRPAGS